VETKEVEKGKSSFIASKIKNKIILKNANVVEMHSLNPISVK
jgi:hypothetical protein